MIELGAVISTLLSVYLTSKCNRLCWPVGIIGVILYFFVFLEENNVLNESLQFIFLVQSVIGWISWKKKKNKTSSLEKWMVFHLFILTSLISLILYFISNYFEGSNSFLDSVTTSLSLVGLFLTAFGKIESWYFWILADLLFVIMFFDNELYLSSLIYLILSVMAIFGIINWKRNCEV